MVMEMVKAMTRRHITVEHMVVWWAYYNRLRQNYMACSFGQEE